MVGPKAYIFIGSRTDRHRGSGNSNLRNPRAFKQRGGAGQEGPQLVRAPCGRLVLSRYSFSVFVRYLLGYKSLWSSVEDIVTVFTFVNIKVKINFLNTYIYIYVIRTIQGFLNIIFP